MPEMGRRTHPVSLLLLAASLLPLGACATRYTPKPDRPFEAIANEFTSTHRIALRNAQPNKEEVRTGPWLANYNAWTDVAIAITDRELQKRGMTLAADAGKTLDLAIESGITETGWVKITSTIVMRATTGDGYTATFTGVNSSAMAANTERQIDGAMMRCVVQMLSDPRIAAYLTQ
jgi:hypothetical protein